jgi:hypothetical protein
MGDRRRRHAIATPGGRQRVDVLTGSGAGVVHGDGLKPASFGASRNHVLV